MPNEASADGGAPRSSSDEESWQEMYDRFTELRWVVSNTRLETFEEARDRTYPEWFDEEIGSAVRAWQLIPYRRGVDHETLELAVEAAKTAMPRLEELFKRRELTAEFARLWGGFCESAGFVSFVYGLEGDDLGPVRAGKTGGDAVSKHRKRQWVAHLLVQLMNKGADRKQAEEAIAEHIRDFVQGQVFPPGFDRDWFRDILNGDESDLRNSYQYARLYPAVVKRLVAEGKDGIPPLPDLDWPI